MHLAVLDLPSPAANTFLTGPASISAVRVLRISVTDRCNYRCLYCMPPSGVPWLPKPDLLDFDEIAHVVRAAVQIHNIRRFKLTGGEPTVRPGLVDLVAMLKRIPGVEDLSLTTNGQLLSELALPLRQAGLDRVTISLDSLDPAKFRRITRNGDLDAVLAGLDRADQAGLPIKINCVTMRGINDDELADFARLTLRRKLTIRFIEYMPLGEASLIDPDSAAFLPESEARQIIERNLGRLRPLDRQTEPGVGPATIWCLSIGRPLGRVGFISAMSAPFCASCNRLRLTPDGLLRSCLFDGGEVDIKPILRAPYHSQPRLDELADAMTQCVRLKPAVHSSHGEKQMSRIGG